MKGFIILLLLLLTTTSCSQESKEPKWKIGDERVGNEPHRKAINGFGSHLLMVKDPQEVIKMWNRPEKPDIQSPKQFGFGESIGVIILFAGCKPDDRGVCNTEVDFMVFKPDGKLLTERKKQKLWKKTAPPPANTHLGEAVLGFVTAKELPVGEYKVRAILYDLNADITMELETQFLLQ